METVSIIATTDLHGLYFKGQQTPRPDLGSLARLRMYLKSILKPDILLDAGDFMGGGLPAYASNHIFINEPHIPALEANNVGYDAFAPGNHDLDAGPDAFMRYSSTLTAPLLAANISGVENVRPWTVIERVGRKIAIIGLVTTESPLFGWSSAHLHPLIESASKAMEEIKSFHSPDLIIGLFHEGPEESLKIDSVVDGFDLIISGHVHSAKGITQGRRAIIVNPGAYGRAIAKVTATFSPSGKPLIEASIEELPLVEPPQMPTHIERLGQTVISENEIWSHELIRQAYLRVFHGSKPLIASKDRLLPEQLTLADTFRYLPYDDYILLLPDGTSVTPHDLQTLFPTLPTVNPQVSPHPLRSYLQIS
ncbi:MAG: metallophosphoesterase [Muribaculaceae bacterium]|nr:metallophosphoesterase [Muribaculaceae bacterium]